MAHLFSQGKRLFPFLLLLYLPTLLGLSIVTLTSIHQETPIFNYMRDPSSITNVSPFIGVISNIGILLWCASAATCLFSWTILRKRAKLENMAHFFLYFGSMGLLLLLDDFFVLHEYIFPIFFGVSEKITYMGYGSLLLLGIILFRGTILQTEYLTLMLSICFFGLSFFVDIFQYTIEIYFGQFRILFEDGFKLLGIVSWFGYFSRCCYNELIRCALDRGLTGSS